MAPARLTVLADTELGIAGPLCLSPAQTGMRLVACSGCSSHKPCGAPPGPQFANALPCSRGRGGSCWL